MARIDFSGWVTREGGDGDEVTAKLMDGFLTCNCLFSQFGLLAYSS